MSRENNIHTCITKPIKSLSTAIQIYYECPELGNQEIIKLFGKLSSTTITRYKNIARKQQREDGFHSKGFNVNTYSAYKAWGIDVKDLEDRLTRLNEIREKIGITRKR